MDKTQFLTIFGTFENLDVVKETLPSVIYETKQNNARLIVHDSSVKNRTKKWTYLQKMNESQDFFLILSDNLSMAHARNMCLALGQQLYAPDYICIMEDDHGMKSGLIKQMIISMKSYYGVVAPNELRFGLFSACKKHRPQATERLENTNHFFSPIKPDYEGGIIGGANSCFRCAPTSHWNNVLKGYDTDEYLISTYQTNPLNYRNYHKGFTTLIVENGELMFDLEQVGRGTSLKSELRLWDEKYTASDPRSKYLK